MQQHTIHFHIRQFCLLLLCLFATEGVMGQTYDFTHSPGRVYDGTMGTDIPDDLKFSNNYKTSADDPRLAEGVTLQRTHEYEREVWCFPKKNEKCVLLPFSDFASVNNYHETYSRWYNYETDQTDNRLTYTNNTNIRNSSNNKGVFGGSVLSGDRTRPYQATFTYPSDESSDADYLGIIAADFGPAGGTNTFSIPSGTGTGVALTEPTLLWRHIFVIKNAKKRADEMMADNAAYIKAHKVKLMAPAGTPFQYRLDAYESQSWGNGATPTGYWYKTSSTDTDYQPIYHYIIETWKVNDDGTETLLGTTIHGNSAYANSSGLTSNLVYTFKENGGTARVLYMSKPTAGKYTIKVYAFGNTRIANPTVSSNALKYNGQPFQLMEYDLEVLSPENGNMITETELKTGDTYKHQRPAEMEKLYGKPTTVVNFDEYTEKAKKSSTTGATDAAYYPFPVAWDNSTYGCGYDNYNSNSFVYDYNMYVLINHNSLAPYHGGTEKNDRVRYDRLSEETNGAQKGMMFYVNAASDPGRMVQLNIGKNFCTGTRVYVSAYLSEFSGDGTFAGSEKANVVFAFKGVDKDGRETNLSNFITGYVTGKANTKTGYNNTTSSTDNPNNIGKWMHVYYSFVPEVPEGSNFDHFIISLENNSVSSEGADYVLDDIQCFVCKPEIKAFQDTPICNGDAFTDLRFEADFDILLTALGIKEKTGEKTNTSTESFYYCFLDKGIYEKEMEGVTTQKGYGNAFDKALIKGVYTEDESYGKLQFESNFGAMKTESEYDKENDPVNVAITNTVTSGSAKKRTLIFPSSSDLNDEKMKVNNEYIMAIMSNPSATELADKFDLTSTCAMTSNIKVASGSQIKIDGQLVSDEDGISVCANQVPTITVDMTGVKEGGEQVSETNTYFDWYMGPYDEAQTAKKESYEEYYIKEKDNNGTNLKTAMDHFRYVYPTKTQDDVVNNNDIPVPTTVDGIEFTSDELACIKYFLGQGKIALYQQVDAINTFDRYTNQKVDLDKARSNKVYTTILPINPKPDDESLKFCLEPFEVIMSISDKAPSMKNGDDSGKIPYPKTMRDVPLRIGLKQLKACCNLTALDATPSHFLFMPLRDVKPYTADDANDKLFPRTIDETKDKPTWSIIQRSSDDLVYLLASNDPNVSMDEDDDKSGAKHAKGDGNVLYIGQVSDIVADANNTGNVCHLAFFDTFKFREGYWYTIKFHFQENYSPGAGEVYDVCPGEVLCTIKVVPEYQMWTGAVDGNWNNEANWRRVSKDDLLKTSAATDEYVTDGTTIENDRDSCFVPADFTKVVIPAASTLSNVPTLYDLRGVDNKETVTFTGAPSSSDFIKFMTLEDAEAALDTASTQAIKDKINAAIAAIKAYDKTAIGAASDTVNFDMASVDITSGTNAGNVACRAWYDHTCDQIHFNSGAEIIGQQYLHYNKAWADVEMEPGRWQTFACPIQNVIAGDFYLPTDGARQNTPLFEDITYDEALNDRFKPAVYQRSWNAKSAKIYHADHTESEAAKSGITGEPITLDWSHVYNDANVRYEPGAGSSIKPDVSALPEAKRPAKVKFRFPKADKTYTYYNPDDVTSAAGYNNIGVPDACLQEGGRTYRLIDFTSNSYVQQIGGNENATQGEEGVLNATDTKYFLVGNPFMCHLSMKEFLKENAEKIEPKYWVVTEKGQRVVVMGADGKVSMTDPNAVGFIGTDATNAEDKLIEPFQSFFVSLKDDAGKALTPKFTPAMMKATPKVSSDPTGEGGEGGGTGGNAKGEMTRSVVPVPESILRISALDNKNHETVMVLTDGEACPTKGAEALFDTNLSDEPMIYSTVKGQAMSIAQILPGDTISIALMGVQDEVTLKLQGAANFGKPLYLVDAVTGEAQSLDGDITLKQSGNGVRYYLATRALEKDEEETTSAPLITTKGLHLTAKAPAGMEIEEIHIYAPNGTCVANDEYVGVQYDVTLSQRGIYLIRLVCDGVDYTYKIALQ